MSAHARLAAVAAIESYLAAPDAPRNPDYDTTEHLTLAGIDAGLRVTDIPPGTPSRAFYRTGLEIYLHRLDDQLADCDEATADRLRPDRRAAWKLLDADD